MVALKNDRVHGELHFAAIEKWTINTDLYVSIEERFESKRMRKHNTYRYWLYQTIITIRTAKRILVLFPSHDWEMQPTLERILAGRKSMPMLKVTVHDSLNINTLSGRVGAADVFLRAH